MRSTPTPTADTATDDAAHLAAYVADLDARYDPDVRMPWCHATGPGYHTRVAEGARAHQTKEAADYAIALLRLGRAERAGEVLDALVALQVTDPLAAHYGIWGWFLEEPPERMDPADWNWADFIGVRLAQVLAGHGDRLAPGLRDRVRAALHHAAMAIFRRNADPGYTNIAVMGAVTVAAAAEILHAATPASPGLGPLGSGLLLEYARRRLRAVLTLHDEAGGFTEYNSPAYGRVVLEELERAALIVADPEFRELAERLRERTWAALAARFHPATGQLAGPMSRAYHDWIQPGLAGYLRAQTGAAIVAREEPRDAPLLVPPLLVPPLPCPPHIAGRFRALPEAPYTVRTRFGSETTGTSWLDEDACLGSAEEEFAWVQRRPLLGYWRTPDDPAVVLRARMLLNGHDLSAAWCRNHQDGPRVLSAWWLSYDSGDFHPALDRPAGSVFHVADLRLVVSLRGRGVWAREQREQREQGEPAAGVLALGAGDRYAVVHTAPGEFLGRTATWRIVEEDGEARAELVLYAGPPTPVDFHHARLRAAFALELLTTGTPPRTAVLTGEETGKETGEETCEATAPGRIHWRWDTLTVTTPLDPTPFGR